MPLELSLAIGALSLFQMAVRSFQSTAFGSTVAGIGDADNDGVPDVAVGALGDGCGRVWVYSGKDGTRLLCVRRDIGVGQALFGRRVARAGDADGDQRADVLVSAVAPQQWNGYVAIVSSQTGKDIAMLRSEAPGDGFGSSLASGDFDDDGVLDVVVGAPNDDFASEDAGAVWVFSGATHKVMHILRGRETRDHFGSRVAVAHDLETDHRIVDLLIASKGAVTVFSGRSGRELHVLRGKPTDLAFGISMTSLDARCGNAGALGEIAVGVALPIKGAEYPSGVVRIFSGASGEMLREIASPQQPFFVGNPRGDSFGYALAPLRDVDGDGCADLAVGAPTSWGNGGGDHGLGYVLSARSGKALSVHEVNLCEPIEFEDYVEGRPWNCGASVDSAGDIDRDGADDVVFGAPDIFGAAAVEVRSGKTGEVIVQVCLRSKADSEPFAPNATAK